MFVTFAPAAAMLPIFGRSVRSTTASVLQIPTTTPIIPKKNHETSTSTVGTVQVADRPC